MTLSSLGSRRLLHSLLDDFLLEAWPSPLTVPRPRQGRTGSTEEGWLGEEGSNLRNHIQSVMSYH